jgi:hypothetical protein
MPPGFKESEVFCYAGQSGSTYKLVARSACPNV